MAALYLTVSLCKYVYRFQDAGFTSSCVERRRVRGLGQTQQTSGQKGKPEAHTEEAFFASMLSVILGKE